MAMKTRRLGGGRSMGSRPLKQADRIGARELELFISSDATLNRQMEAPIQKALVNRLAGGTFSKTLALKAFQNLTEEGAKRYNKEFGDGTLSVKGFDKSTRTATAGSLLSSFIVEANLGNFDNSLNQKNKGAIWDGKVIQVGTKVTVTFGQDVERLGVKKGKKASAEIVRTQLSGTPAKQVVDTSQPVTVSGDVLLRFPNNEFARVPNNLVKEA